jgi:hypothetical protein
VTKEEALALVSAYDRACEDIDRRPGSKSAARRFNEVFARLIAALMSAEAPRC